MYSVSQKYVEAMKRPVQRHRIKGTVNGVAFTEDNILSGSFTITCQCSDTSNVQIGQVYTSELKITLLKGLPISRYTLMGSEIIPHFGLRLDTGAYEYIPLGVFTVSSASWAASGVEITAYDNMSKLDRSFSSSSLTGTPYELLTLACTSCGLELAMRSRDFNSLANGRRILTLFADNDIDTWRDCVSWIAQACCCNVFADRYGKIILKAYNQNVSDRIDTEHRLTGSTFGDYETHYTGLSVVDIEKQMTVYYSEPEDNGLTYNLGSNPFLQTDSDELREEMCREILSAMDQIHYVPFTVDMIGKPAYDLMDILCFEGGFADSSKISCITKYTFHYNAKYSVTGVGTNPALASAKSKSDKNLSGLMAQVSSITSSINRLIYDYNTGPLIVGQDEQTLGMVTYYISQKADVEGHFLMNYTASESTHLTLRFYDQGVEELYSPLEMDILEGEGSIGIPHAYLNRGVGIHGVYVTATVLSGHLDIDTRGVFFTIDAGNFAEAVDDISMDVRDITMRQLLESNGPDQIWIVGIEEGKMLVSRRDYRESYTSNPVWTGVYTAGDAIDAAIEFDGTWVLRDSADNFTIETEDQPWYFWVTPEGELLAQHGEDETSRTTLDTNVTAVSACRGYSSNLYPEQDQGLVAAYIKNGRPYYRQYVFDVGLGTKHWLDTELLIDEPVDSFRVHRLNDYRLGFELSNENRNLWLYTSRTYVAQSVPREIENFFMQENLAFLYCPADTDLSVHYELLVSEDLMNIQIGVDRELVCFDTSMRDVITFNEDSVEYSDVEKISYENYEGSALITILLKKPPAKLITHIYINAAKSNDLQCRIGQWGTIVSPSETLTIDTTIYRRMQMEEKIGIRSTGIGLRYSPIRERRQAMKETVTFTSLSSGLHYAHVREHPYEPETEIVMIGSLTSGIEYKQTGESPV